MKNNFFAPFAVKNAFIFLLALFFIGCGYSAPSLFPPTELSVQKIAEMKPQLDSLDAAINARAKVLPANYNSTTRITIASINRLLDLFAQQRADDISIAFLPTQPLWKEEKNILGIKYTNLANIDSGAFSIDIKKFRFKWGMNNMLNAEVEIEGKGTIAVSGTYAGISASASPQLHCYLNENILFSIAADSESIILKPQTKTLTLKAKATMKLLQWEIPIYKEVPLQATDIIQPMKLPAALRSDIAIPLPAKEFGSSKVEFVRRTIEFSNAKVSAVNNVLGIQGNISLKVPAQ